MGTDPVDETVREEADPAALSATHAMVDPHLAPAVVRPFGRYELRRELGRGTTGIVFEAFDRRTNAVVALKTLASVNAENLFRLKHEFRSLANLEHESFVRFGELGCEAGQWFFTMERVHGTDFLSYVRGDARREASVGAEQRSGVRSRVAAEGAIGVGLEEARLRGALARLVEGLAALHEAGRVHRDVKPSNVLVSDEGRVVLLDFGLMTTPGATDQMSGTPAYMAPEQIDGETLTPAADWYAVGVMLYAALRGELPFRGEVMEILRAKLTTDAPTEWEAPEDLRALCLDLLAREPSARPTIDEIRVRLGLAPPAAHAREVFVGRDEELARLRELFADVEARGARGVVVRGEAGIGKSALVEHFLAELPAQAVVLRGRCYEQESVPFSGVDSLVDALSEYLLGLSPEDVARLLEAGVSNVARVFPVLCRVQLIAAQRPQGPVLNPALVREQAFTELTRLLAALGRSRSLVVFVDDLQWVDDDGLVLMRRAFVSRAVRCLFVATLRADTARSRDLDALVKSLERIEVGRLSGEESARVFRALGAADDGAREAVLREADGHPFFLAELLRSGARRVSARLEEVLLDRVAARDAIEQRFLEAAALAGAPTPYGVLARAAGLDVGDCLTRLSSLRATQLVRVSRVDDDRCVEPYHDRVRETLIERVRARGALADLHLALGRALAEATSGTALASRVFGVVQHYNLGRARITSAEERRTLARLNLLASREAHRATAFERAREYATIGIECLGPDAPADDVATFRDLHVARFVAEYLTLGRDVARATLDAVNARLRAPQDKATVYIAWIDLEASDHPRDAVAAGCEVVAELGFQVPYPASKRHVVAEYAMARWAQRRRPAAEFENAPPLADEATRSALGVLVAMLAPAFFCDENLFPWISLHIARVTMSAGVCEASPIGLAGYGVTLTGLFGKHAEAAEFGALAVRLANRDREPRILPRTEFVNAAFISPWAKRFEEALADLKRAHRAAATYGDTQYETYACGMLAELSICMGSDIDASRPWLERQHALARLGSESGTQEQLASAYELHAHALRGKTSGLTSLDRPGTPESAVFGTIDEDLPLVRYHYCRADLEYLAGADVAGTMRHLDEVERCKQTTFAMPLAVEIRFLRALVLARACPSAPALRRAGYVLEIARTARAFGALARSCPANFEPYALIVRAELDRVLGRASAAAAGYERAIRSARTHHATKREAIACELASAHARGDAETAQRYRALAADAYRRWGATAKADALLSG